MELHNLKNAPGARKQRKRVGRGHGSGSGKTAGKGHKGQQSRAGYSKHPGFEGGQMPLHRRLPKRGFNHGRRWPMAVVNLDALDAAFADGAEVTAVSVAVAGLAKKETGGVKILGRGELTKKLTLKVEAISASAKAKVEAAGGTVEVLKAKAASNAETPAAAPAEPAPETAAPAEEE